MAVLSNCLKPPENLVLAPPRQSGWAPAHQWRLPHAASWSSVCHGDALKETGGFCGDQKRQVLQPRAPQATEMHTDVALPASEFCVLYKVQPGLGAQWSVMSSRYLELVKSQYWY